MLVPHSQLLLLSWSCLHPYCLCPFFFHRQLELFWLGRTAE